MTVILIFLGLIFVLLLLAFSYWMQKMYYSHIIRQKLKKIGFTIISINGTVKPKEIPEYKSESNFLMDNGGSPVFVIYLKVICNNENQRLYSCYAQIKFFFLFIVSVHLYPLEEIQKN